MANSKQAKKRVLQNERNRQRNMTQRSNMRTHIKNVRKAVDSKNLELAHEQLKLAIAKIDKLVSKGMVHKNTAARKKSRLNKLVKTAEQAA